MTKKDVLWVSIITVAVVTMVFVAMRGSEVLRQSNDDKVIVQFVTQQLNICNEKLAAYGEDVDLDIPIYKFKSEDLKACLEKLSAYGEDSDISVTQ